MVHLRNVCVYCGSSNAVAAAYLDAAFELGRLIGDAGIGLVYGGGGLGLMGRLADGAVSAGGRVTGIIPRHLQERELARPAVGETVLVDSMHERKRIMAERSDGFIVLPGGFGTLDEMFEIVTWRQLGLHDKPIVLVDVGGYWEPLQAMVDRMGAEGFVGAQHQRLFMRVDGVAAALPTLRRAEAPHVKLSSDQV